MNNMQLVEYNIETAVIEGLTSKYMDIEKIADSAGYAFVMTGLRECREIRLTVDQWHKDKKEWILKAGRFYDDEKKRVHGLVKPIESHLEKVRQAEDDRKKAIKAEKDRIEQERVNGIREKIFAFQKVNTQLGGKSSVELQQIIAGIMDITIDESYMEFAEEAKTAKADVMTAIEDAYDAQIKWEREEVARKVEAERLAKQKAEQEEKEKVLAEERRKIDEERAKLAREEFERKFKEEAKAQAEKEAKEKAEREERERIAREKADAEEKARQEALKPDREKLLTFAQDLLAITGPKVQDKKVKAILADALDGLSQISATIKTEVEDL